MGCCCSLFGSCFCEDRELPEGRSQILVVMGDETLWAGVLFLDSDCGAVGSLEAALALQ